MRPHLGDDAELLALGALDTREATLAMVHAQHCAPCGARLAAAAEIVAALDAAAPQTGAPASLRTRLRAPRRFGIRLPAQLLAVAAIVIVAFAVASLLWSRRDTQTVALDRSATVRAIVHGHFNHLTLAPVAPQAPAAKVLFARDGSWAYLVVDTALPGARFVSRGTTKAETPLAVRGDVSEAFLPDVHHAQRFILIASTGEILGEASVR